jgi:hypothetical protein
MSIARSGGKESGRKTGMIEVTSEQVSAIKTELKCGTNLAVAIAKKRNLLYRAENARTLDELKTVVVQFIQEIRF